MDAEENQKQVSLRAHSPWKSQTARFPHFHRRDEAMEKWKTKNRFSTFPLPTICLLLPNSERRPGGGASLLLQAHCSIRICCRLSLYRTNPIKVPARARDRILKVARPLHRASERPHEEKPNDQTSKSARAPGRRGAVPRTTRAGRGGTGLFSFAGIRGDRRVDGQRGLRLGAHRSRARRRR